MEEKSRPTFLQITSALITSLAKEVMLLVAESESESDIYSATINEDYYAAAGVVSKGSVHHVIERIGSGKMKSKR